MTTLYPLFSGIHEMTIITQIGFTSPLNLAPRQRASRRYELGALIDRRNSAFALNPNNSMLQPLEHKSHQCLNQILNQNFDLRRTQDSGWVRNMAPVLSASDNVISRGHLLTRDAHLPWLPRTEVPVDLHRLDAHHAKAPWLPNNPWAPGFFSFDQTYPRARALCYLHGMVNVGSPTAPVFKRTSLALDRAAGRLYLLALLLSKVDTGISIALNTPEFPGLYPCSQLVLSNFP
jgi:hypothetical protein